MYGFARLARLAFVRSSGQIQRGLHLGHVGGLQIALDQRAKRGRVIICLDGQGDFRQDGK